MDTPSQSESPAPDDSLDPNTWVQTYGDSLFRFAVGRLGNTALAEDLVQESFLAGLKAREQFRGESGVSTWLFSILRRKIADHFRSRRSKEVPLSHDDMEPSARAAKGASKSRKVTDPAEILEDREFWAVFNACVDKLPDLLAEAFAMREINQHSPKEICKILGITATNLSMRLHRSRAALKECLQLNWFQDHK